MEVRKFETLSGLSFRLFVLCWIYGRVQAIPTYKSTDSMIAAKIQVMLSS